MPAHMAHIQQAGNPRVTQRCENLPLAEKPLPERRKIGTGSKKLDGDALLEFSVGPLGEVNRAHSAVT